MTGPILIIVYYACISYRNEYLISLPTFQIYYNSFIGEGNPE